MVSFARIAASKVFRRILGPLLRKLGVTKWSNVHALGDGAGWIWKSVGRVLPGCRETLDIYHASERLSLCAQELSGQETTEACAAFERGPDLLVREG